MFERFGNTLNVLTVDGVETFELTSPEVNDGISWDSAGNDAPHDGNGAGSYSGDHTNYGVTFESDRIAGTFTAQFDPSASAVTVTLWPSFPSTPLHT